MRSRTMFSFVPVFTLMIAAALTAPVSAATAPAHPAAASARRAATRHAAPKAKATPPVASAPDSATPEEPAVVDADAESLLTHVGRAYQGFSSYHFTGNSHMEISLNGQSQAIDVPFQLAAVKPSKMRTEIQNPMMSVTSVSDGAQTWVYVSQAHQYTHQDAAPVGTTGGNPADIGNALATGTPIQRYVTPLQGLQGARILGKDHVTVDGRDRACTVVAARFATPPDQPVTMSPNTFWVDDATHAVLRDSVQILMPHGAPDGSAVTMRTITTFARAIVNQPVADSLFRFRPPADAQLVDQISMGGASPKPSPLVGKPAQDFELADLQGARHTLSGLKGKVVLLDFWATWCGPCRLELPHIVKLHHELAAKGLAVVAVNIGEEQGVVSGFLRQTHYELPVWLDAERKAADLYGANAIPTLVVIDRDGVVSTLAVGLRGEDDLRAMLKKAGL